MPKFIEFDDNSEIFIELIETSNILIVLAAQLDGVDRLALLSEINTVLNNNSTNISRRIINNSKICRRISFNIER